MRLNEMVRLTKLSPKLITLIHQFILSSRRLVSWNGDSVLMHFLDSDFREATGGRGVIFHRIARFELCGNAAMRQHTGKAPHRVGATTEPQQEDAVARSPKPDDHSVTIYNIGGQPKTRRLAKEIMSNS